MNDDHALIGAWALDAVDPAERARVERHLDACPSCAQEAAELRETAARLADATVAEPPPRLREAVLAEVRRTRQEAPPEPAPQAREAVRRSRSRGHRRLRLALGAAALAVVAAFAGVVATWSAMHRGEDQGDRIAAVLEAADAEVATTAAEGGGRVTVVASASMDQAVVVVADLASPGDEHAYQLWMIDAEGKSSAGVMDPGDGSATMLLDGLGDTEMIAVTMEPAGGSDTPTMPMVADVPLDA